jgi:hypothetical protein
MADDDTAAATGIITTEHFVLQSAKSSGTAEAVSRVSIFLTVVSGTLVAAAFVAQLREPAAVGAFGLIVLIAVLFVGLTTFSRVLQIGIDDLHYTRRINRLRRFYVDHAPIVGRYVEAPSDDSARALLVSEGLRPGPWQLLQSLAGAVSVINALLAGAIIGVGFSLGLPASNAAAAVGGLIAFGVALYAQTLYQHRRRSAASGE